MLKINVHRCTQQQQHTTLSHEKMRTHHHHYHRRCVLCTGWRHCCTTLCDRTTMLCKCTQHTYSRKYRQWQHVSATATVRQHRNVCDAGENMLLISVCFVVCVVVFGVSEGRMCERQMRTALYPKNCNNSLGKKES